MTMIPSLNKLGDQYNMTYNNATWYNSGREIVENLKYFLSSNWIFMNFKATGIIIAQTTVE